MPLTYIIIIIIIIIFIKPIIKQLIMQDNTASWILLFALSFTVLRAYCRFHRNKKLLSRFGNIEKSSGFHYHAMRIQ